MRHVRWLSYVIVVTIGLGASSASAQARLPYEAYGSGVPPEATIEALRGDAVLSKTAADADGNWVLQVSAEAAADGDVIGFTVNGRRAKETVTFRSARFVAPPGLALTTDGQHPFPAAVSPTDGKTAGTPTPSRIVLVAAGIGMLSIVAVGAVLFARRRGRQGERR